MGMFNHEMCKECKIFDGSLTKCMEECGVPLHILEDYDMTQEKIKKLDGLYTEKCEQIKEIVKRLEKEADEARAGGNPEISGAYQIAIWTIKDITGIGGLSDEQRDIISWEKD